MLIVLLEHHQFKVVAPDARLTVWKFATARLRAFVFPEIEWGSLVA